MDGSCDINLLRRNVRFLAVLASPVSVLIPKPKTTPTISTRIGLLSDDYHYNMVDLYPGHRLATMAVIIVVEVVFALLGWIAAINERRLWLNIWYGVSAVQFIVIVGVCVFLATSSKGFGVSSTQFYLMGGLNVVTHLATVVFGYLYSRSFGVGMPEVFQLRVNMEKDEEDGTESDSQDDNDSIISGGSFSNDY